MIKANYKRVAEFVINPGPNSRTLTYPDFTLEFDQSREELNIGAITSDQEPTVTECRRRY